MSDFRYQGSVVGLAGGLAIVLDAALALVVRETRGRLGGNRVSPGGH